MEKKSYPLHRMEIKLILLHMINSEKFAQIRNVLVDILSKMSCVQAPGTTIYFQKVLNAEMVSITWLLFVDNEIVHQIKNALQQRQDVCLKLRSGHL